MDTDVHKYSDYMDDDNDDDSVQVGLEYDITLSSLLAIMIKYRASLLIIVRGWSKGLRLAGPASLIIGTQRSNINNFVERPLR